MSGFSSWPEHEQAEFLATWKANEDIANAEFNARLAQSEWVFRADGTVRIESREFPGVYVQAGGMTESSGLRPSDVS